MTFLHRLYQYINILSLDVVAGAVTGALFFGELLQVPIDPFVLAALALTVLSMSGMRRSLPRGT